MTLDQLADALAANKYFLVASGAASIVAVVIPTTVRLVGWILGGADRVQGRWRRAKYDTARRIVASSDDGQLWATLLVAELFKAVISSAYFIVTTLSVSALSPLFHDPKYGNALNAGTAVGLLVFWLVQSFCSMRTLSAMFFYRYRKMMRAARGRS